MVGDASGMTWFLAGLGLCGAGLLGFEVWLATHLIGQRHRLSAQLVTIENRVAAAVESAPRAGVAERRAPVTAPGFRLPSVGGTDVELESLLSQGRPVLLLFIDPRKDSETLLSEVGAWQRKLGDPLTVAMVSAGTKTDVNSILARHRIGPVLLQEDFSVSRDYDVRFAPAAVLVQPNGVLAGVPVYGTPAISTMLERLAPAAAEAMASQAQLDGSKTLVPGAPAPPFHLNDPEGNAVDLASFAGQPLLLLFWNPKCGYCDRIKHDLMAWTTNPPQDAPRLLVVARGTAEENADLERSNPLVLDLDLTTNRAYGIRGTPSAVLIDADGRVVSTAARGVRAVRALIGLDQSLSAESVQLAGQNLPSTDAL